MATNKYFSFGATLAKSAGSDLKVGGVASAFLKDLDGDALEPDAIRRAIPAFMADRGPDGIQGGPIRLNHNLWSRFLKDAIAALRLSPDEQMEMIASISLPLGRVTKIWVDEAGVTQWQGMLSKANPIAGVVWKMLKEGLVHLGVSVGGQILGVRRGSDARGMPCNLITDIRLDELSVTDNPAFRLVQGETEDNGAYIMALAKSAGVDAWLQKTLNSSAPKQFTSGSFGETRTGLSHGIGETSLRPKGSRKIKLQAVPTKTGIGAPTKKCDRAGQQSGAGHKQIATDVFGLTIGQMTKELAKSAAISDIKAMSAPDHLQFLTDCCYGLAGSMESPPGAIVNLMRFLGEFCKFAGMLPHMDGYQASGTIAEMGPALMKSLEDFEEKFPKDLMGTPVRPSGSPRPVSQTVLFPQQYVVYN
ncbi:HK97 family phage prohead protease [Leptothoe spongobia]|uniref:Uncharacterized protein n=1 Tax=Leptothoe spongobia TAU-MAC 1115 TaxID=1967444 RepID=A0A947DH70_9CYAN|nr:hypothetical protein [Leptothoe spongobia]MBT9316304.1 hypothetical protein [Leptothoe spongobia TAU-MAC 1115]